MTHPIDNETLEQLAVRYGLIPPGSSEGLDQLVARRKIRPEDMEFLRAKAEYVAGDAPPEKRPFLDLASHLSYLTARELLRIGFQVGYQGEDRDYRVASLINHQRLMPGSRIIDLLERLALPLFYCAHDRTVYYPFKRADARRGVACPQCRLQLIPMTSIPALNLSAPPLVEFAGLAFQVLEAAKPGSSTSGRPLPVAVAGSSGPPAAVAAPAGAPPAPRAAPSSPPAPVARAAAPPPSSPPAAPSPARASAPPPARVAPSPPTRPLIRRLLDETSFPKLTHADQFDDLDDLDDLDALDAAEAAEAESAQLAHAHEAAVPAAVAHGEWADDEMHALEPAELSDEDALEPHELSDEDALEPHELSDEDALEPYELSDEDALEPHELSDEDALEPAELSDEDALEPHELSDEDALEPHELSDEDALEPAELLDEDALEPHELPDEDALEPHELSDEDAFEPAELSDEDALEPHELSDEDAFEPAELSDEDALEPLELPDHGATHHTFAPAAALPDEDTLDTIELPAGATDDDLFNPVEVPGWGSDDESVETGELPAWEPEAESVEADELPAWEPDEPIEVREDPPHRAAPRPSAATPRPGSGPSGRAPEPAFVESFENDGLLRPVDAYDTGELAALDAYASSPHDGHAHGARATEESDDQSAAVAGDPFDDLDELGPVDDLDALEPFPTDDLDAIEPIPTDDLEMLASAPRLEPIPSDELPAFEPLSESMFEAVDDAVPAVAVPAPPASNWPVGGFGGHAAAQAASLAALEPFDDAFAAEHAYEAVEAAPAPPPRTGFTRSFVVQNRPMLVEDEDSDELPLVEVADEEPLAELEIDLHPNDTGLLAAFNAPPVRRRMSAAEDRLRQVAVRYHILDAESLDQALDLWRQSDPEAGTYLVQGGFITGEALTFMRARRAEVDAAGGLGPIGLHYHEGVLDRAYAQGYLNSAEVGALITSRGMTEDSDPLALLQLLFNHGLLELFQLVDLLEGRGILMWHCPSCMTQMPEIDEPIDACPNDESPLLCLTGWGDPADAELPLPAITRLIGAVSPSLSLEPPGPQHVTEAAALAAFAEDAAKKGARSIYDTFEIAPALVFEALRDDDDDDAPQPSIVFGDAPTAAYAPSPPTSLTKPGAGARPDPRAPAKPVAAAPAAGKPGVAPKAAPAKSKPAAAEPAKGKPGAEPAKSKPTAAEPALPLPPAIGPGRSPGKQPAVEPAAIRELALHYHLMTGIELAEATRQVVPGTSLFDILDRFGYLKPPALAFLRRQLGLDPVPQVRGMGEAAKKFGYVSSLPGPLGIIDGMLPIEVEVPLVAEAYNMGFLPLFQFYDLFDSTSTAIDFCSYCQLHYFVPDPARFHANCPECDSLLEPVTGPRAWKLRKRSVPLARFNRLRIKTYERRDIPASGVMLAMGASDPNDSDESVAVVAPETVLPEHDTLIFTLVEQYLLLSAKELNKAWNKREFFADPKRVPPLEEFLKTDGWLGEKEYRFLRSKNQQLRSGLAGEQTGFSIGELGISKGYLNRGRFVQLMGVEGAPSREDGEASIAGYLFNHKALQFFQVLDLLECCAVLLMACPDCGDQTQIDEFEADREYPCPICWQPLLALTIPPGRVPRLMQIPKIEQFRVFRISAHELPEMG